MKTSYLVGVIAAILIIGGVFWFMSQNTTPAVTTNTQPTMQMPADQTQPPAQTTGATVNTQTTAPAPVTAPATSQAVSVAINNFAFTPKQITVKAGTKVTWTNSDSTTHTVTSNTGAFDSGNVNPGSSYSFTFNTPGTYSYHCKIHPSMTATVVVTQ